MKKLFFVPVGLPGMGKTTLARHLEHHLSSSTDSKFLFKKLSYDKILTDHLEIYQKGHPEVPFHDIIDKVRSQADQEYLDQIERLGREKEERPELIYLDRNNTPNVWPDIARALGTCPNKSFLILPEQAPFDFSLYEKANSLSPQFMYECMKRIFQRKSHDCLSSENKPKVVEVILKFARFYDGLDLKDPSLPKKHFDEVLQLEFMNFQKRKPIQQAVFDSIVMALNATPENFLPPDDEVLATVVKSVDWQMQMDLEGGEDDVLMEETVSKEVGKVMTVALEEESTSSSSGSERNWDWQEWMMTD